MLGFDAFAAAVRRLLPPIGRERPRAKGALNVRPDVERLESIDLLSTMGVRAGALREHVRPHKVERTADIQAVLPANYGITGVRQDAGGNVAITGGTGAPSLKDGTPAFIYYGPLDQMPSSAASSSLHLFTPEISGQTVTGAQFYGPNTPLFDPSLGSGNIRAVGAYRYTGSSFQTGVIYAGPLDGSGTYTPISAPGDGSAPVGDTIPHSTMGSLVVGNFDYQDSQTRGHGFIYDMSNDTYTTVDLGRYGTTLYGVWQNGGPSSTEYTIVGGLSGNARGGQAFIANYDSTTRRFSDLRTYSFKNKPSLVTHFEGISAVPGGFSIAATQASRRDFGASYAFIPVRKDGSFGAARWVAMKNDVNRAPTTGDTVIGTTVMGIYPLNSTQAGSYLADIRGR